MRASASSPARLPALDRHGGSGVDIDIAGLTFAYRRGGEAVLRDFSHRFAAGSLTAVVGRSGSGKSTLLYLAALMLRCRTGAIRLGDTRVDHLADGQRARMRAALMGFVFQDALLDPARSVLDNVCEPGVFAGMSRSHARGRAHELLDRFGIAARATHRPGEISGGQAQRVALCRALVTGPTVVFGDEPTGNLDSESADIVWDALTTQARRGATVIVATHDPLRAASADQLVDVSQ